MVAGCLLLVGAFDQPRGPDLGSLLAGASLVSLGLAERLPPRRRALAVALRMVWLLATIVLVSVLLPKLAGPVLT